VRDGNPFPRRQHWPSTQPLIIGLGGGSGSGKTTIALSIVEAIGPDRVTLIQHDAYYHDQTDLPLEERVKVNYDHPDSFETSLLIHQLRELRVGRAVEKPLYDFTVYNRRPETVRVEPKPVVIVEGILVLHEPELRELMDLKIYVDTDPDLRILRRLERDLKERDRSFDSVHDQYLATVRPMHLQFVEPSKRYADIVIPEGYNTGAVGTVISMIREVLRPR
jgi:uridine kinase